MQESTSASLTARIDDYDEICRVVQLYMDGVAKGDVSKLKEAFHGDARMFGSFLRTRTSSCRRHEMDPQLYFMQLLMNLPSWPANDLDAWLPDRWKQAHADRCAALEIPPLDS